ncbi:MAG TPA: head-tail adaptor protein, partial [Xanthobacteraceae bacterium]|nr:head-tail adaptor protein [Xanthobacteraceae bacterium]
RQGRRIDAGPVAEDLRPARGVSRSDGGLMARGDRRHLVTFQAPTTGVDADGNYTQTWTDLNPPTWFVSIEPATTADLERVAAGTVISSASHLVRGDFHPGVTTETRMLLDSLTFAITGVVNVEMRSVEMVCGAVQVVA